MRRHRVFISYYHKDQFYKNKLVKLSNKHNLFIDGSVNTNDIDSTLPDKTIRQKIRDEYLRDTTVTIVLVGKDTDRRKHVDWEIYSSMINSKKNKRSGIVVIYLHGQPKPTVAHEGEKTYIYARHLVLDSDESLSIYQREYPGMPQRILDNLINESALISVTRWDIIRRNPCKLKWLIDAAFNDRSQCKYDLSRPMRRRNSPDK